jgi:hypothetical protein
MQEKATGSVASSGGKLSTTESVGHVVRVKKQLESEPGLNDFVTMAVDADGLGAGVVDRLVELGHSVGEIRGEKASIEPEDYVNRRSEWYWNLRERFEHGDIDTDPDDAELTKQLGNIKWKMMSKGQIAVERTRPGSDPNAAGASGRPWGSRVARQGDACGKGHLVQVGCLHRRTRVGGPDRKQRRGSISCRRSQWVSGAPR